MVGPVEVEEGVLEAEGGEVWFVELLQEGGEVVVGVGDQVLVQVLNTASSVQYIMY